MAKLIKKQTDGSLKEKIKGSKGTFTATKEGNVMSGIGGRLTSMDTTGYAKGKKNYQVNTADYVTIPGTFPQKVGDRRTKTITKKEVIPTINKMKNDIKKSGGTVKSKKK